MRCLSQTKALKRKSLTKVAEGLIAINGVS